MDAVGSNKAVLIGWGDEAAIAAMFASTHPTRSGPASRCMTEEIILRRSREGRLLTD